ncbi:MAG: hypothetical protein AAF471_09480 [Myxococcota bacterium]
MARQLKRQEATPELRKQGVFSVLVFGLTMVRLGPAAGVSGYAWQALGAI